MEFKKLSDVEVVEAPAESANVLIEENGVIKKTPKTAIGGGEADMVIHVISENADSEPVVSIISGSYDEVAQKIDYMKPVSIQVFLKDNTNAYSGIHYPYSIEKFPSDDGNMAITIGTNIFYFVIFPDNTIIID